MANIERGEIEVVVNDKPYTLKMTMNASVAVQMRTKKTLGQLMAAAEGLDVEAIRDIVFVLLQKHHGAEFKTVSSVGDFIDDAGGLKTFFTTLQQLAKANEPEDPQNAQAPNPTGESLSETPVATAV
jgi:hypothetical protein